MALLRNQKRFLSHSIYKCFLVDHYKHILFTSSVQEASQELFFRCCNSRQPPALHMTRNRASWPCSSLLSSWFQLLPWGAGCPGAGKQQPSPTEECYGSSRPLLTPPDPTWLPRSPSSLFAWAFNSDWGPRRAHRHPKMAAAPSLSGSAPWRPPRPAPAFPPAGPGWGRETPAWRPLGLCSKWRDQSHPQCWSKHGVPHRDVHSPHSWGRSPSSAGWLGGSRPSRQRQIVLVSKCTYNRGKKSLKWSKMKLMLEIIRTAHQNTATVGS